jgi:integrase
LQVSETLTKSWIFRYARNGKSREMGLGSARLVSLAQARERALECQRSLVEGRDPIAERDARIAKEKLQSAGAITFAECGEKYVASHRAGWRNPKHAAQWASTLATYAGPVIGGLATKDIATALVLRVLEPIWTKKPETAARLRGRMERILDWARVMGYRDGDNPARWRGHLDKLLPSARKSGVRRHHAALAYTQIRAFIRRLSQEEGAAARALEFTILTLARTSEVIGARKAEFDLEKRIWIVPATRTKNGREHRVPLSPRVVKIVGAQPGPAFVFNGRGEGRPLSNMAMLELLKRMGRQNLTVHGFRSTFRDWAAECTSYPNEVCEMALAHAIADKVEAAYRRGDLFEKRRRLMLEWSNYCGVARKSLPFRKAAGDAEVALNV